MTAYIGGTQTPMFPSLRDATYIMVCGDGQYVEMTASSEAEALEFAETFIRERNKPDHCHLIRLDPKRYDWAVLSRGTYNIVEVVENSYRTNN